MAAHAGVLQIMIVEVVASGHAPDEVLVVIVVVTTEAVDHVGLVVVEAEVEVALAVIRARCQRSIQLSLLTKTQWR